MERKSDSSRSGTTPVKTVISDTGHAKIVVSPTLWLTTEEEEEEFNCWIMKNMHFFLENKHFNIRRSQYRSGIQELNSISRRILKIIFIFLLMWNNFLRRPSVYNLYEYSNVKLVYSRGRIILIKIRFL